MFFCSVAILLLRSKGAKDVKCNLRQCYTEQSCQLCDVAILVEWFSEAQSSRVPHLHTPHVLTLGLLPDRSVSSTAQAAIRIRARPRVSHLPQLLQVISG